MTPRRPFDHRLRPKKIPVRFLSGAVATASAEGNNAAWQCGCGAQLVGRCYFQFGDICHTVCDGCGRQFRVLKGPNRSAVEVVEETVSQPQLSGVR